MSEERQEEHGGVIRISREVLDLLLNDTLKIDDCDTQGSLRERGVFAEIRKRLLLPENYIIHGVYWKWMPRYWEVVVESPDLPIAQEGRDLPIVSPLYCTYEDGRVEIKNIKVEEDHWSKRQVIHL